MSLCLNAEIIFSLQSGSAGINEMLVFIETEIEKNMEITMLLTNTQKCADHAGAVQGAARTSVMF